MLIAAAQWRWFGHRAIGVAMRIVWQLTMRIVWQLTRFTSENLNYSSTYYVENAKYRTEIRLLCLIVDGLWVSAKATRKHQIDQPHTHKLAMDITTTKYRTNNWHGTYVIRYINVSCCCSWNGSNILSYDTPCTDRYYTVCPNWPTNWTVRTKQIYCRWWKYWRNWK